MQIVIDSKMLLNAALLGFHVTRKQIDEQIEAISALLAGKNNRPAQKALPTAKKESGGKRNLSKEARAKIAAAQKKRWEAFRKQQASKKNPAKAKEAAAA